jgi:hypothetical protein
VERISYLLRALVQAIARDYTRPTPNWPASTPWGRPDATALHQIRLEMGSSSRVSESSAAILFSESNCQVTVLDASLAYILSLSTQDLLRDMGRWITVSTTRSSSYMTHPQPDAVLIAYQVIHEDDATDLLHTTAGRQELRAFIVTQLFPRLRTIDNPTSHDEDDDMNDACVSQLYTYLHHVYFWLGHPPRSTMDPRWGQPYRPVLSPT